jgi:hypothetical protein
MSWCDEILDEIGWQYGTSHLAFIAGLQKDRKGREPSLVVSEPLIDNMAILDQASLRLVCAALTEAPIKRVHFRERRFKVHQLDRCRLVFQALGLNSSLIEADLHMEEGQGDTCAAVLLRLRQITCVTLGQPVRGMSLALWQAHEGLCYPVAWTP